MIQVHHTVAADSGEETEFPGSDSTKNSGAGQEGIAS